MTPSKVRYLDDQSGNHGEVVTLSDLLRNVIAFLHNRPTWNEVARYINLGGIPALDLRQVTIYEVIDDSQLRVLGTFGEDLGKGNLAEASGSQCSLLDAMLRWHTPQTDLSRTALAAEDGDIRGATGARDSSTLPQLLWPLKTPLRLQGVLQVRFTDSRISELAEAEVSQVASVLALLLDLIALHDEARLNIHAPTSWLQTHDGNDVGVGRQGNSVWRRSEKPAALTPRQLQVLQFMSEGRTNSQIARELKFSESTIRQETMAIYRFFSVPGRVDAVAEGRRRGLLEIAHSVAVVKGDRELDREALALQLEATEPLARLNSTS